MNLRHFDSEDRRDDGVSSHISWEVQLPDAITASLRTISHALSAGLHPTQRGLDQTSSQAGLPVSRDDFYI